MSLINSVLNTFLKRVIRILEISKWRLEYPKTDWNNNGQIILSGWCTSLFILLNSLLKGEELQENIEFIQKDAVGFY